MDVRLGIDNEQHIKTGKISEENRRDHVRIFATILRKRAAEKDKGNPENSC